MKKRLFFVLLSLTIFLASCASQKVILTREFDRSLPVEKKKEIYAANKMRIKPGFLGGPRFLVGESGQEFSHEQVLAYFITSSTGTYSSYDLAIGQQSGSTLFHIFGWTYLLSASTYFVQARNASGINFSAITALALGSLCVAAGILFGALSFDNFKKAVDTYNWDLMNGLNLKSTELTFTGGLDSLGLQLSLKF